MNIHDIGDQVRLTGRLLDYDDQPVNATVACYVTTPSGVTTTAPVINEDVGLYRAYILPEEPGIWTYRFAATGAVISAARKRFTVRQE